MNYKRVEEKVAVLQRVLVATENQLSRMPSEIELSSEKIQLEQYKFIYENLYATVSRLEVESMAEVTEEAVRVARISKDLETELKQARRYQAALEVVIPKLTEKLNNLSTQITDLGTHPTQPISWTHSTATLTNLMRQDTEIGKVNKGRSLEEVERDLDLATRLKAECEDLNQAIQQTRQQHVELLALYDAPELRQVGQWMQYAQNLVVQVAAYAPENWAPIDGVRGLPSELDAFEGDVSRLLPSIQPEIIQDTEIQHRLNDTRELSATYNTLRRRIENIQNRLTDIQGSERSARERMETAQAVFNQLSFIISSNDFLFGVAEKEINRVQGELHKLDSELAMRQSGTIENKNKAVAELISKFELYANRWLDLLTGEIEVKVDSISASLAALDAISSLDERAIFQARRLLTSGQSMGLSSSDADTRISLEKIVTTFKPRSDYWQSCTAALLALEDVERPVIESYTEANQNRQNVREQFAEIDTWLPAERAWPPISVTLDSEREELNSIEESWKSLRGEHIRAIALVARLGNISARYQTLAERIYRVVETVQKDQDQIEELEMDINAFVHQWQSLVKAYRDNPAASKEIREMLDEIGSDRSQIKRQYQSGVKNYRQVMEDLKMIQRKLNYFQVELDEDHALDINGRVIRRQ
jgi:chromosome segregation ATPase